MICAYDKVYLEKARTVLGCMLDFSVYDLKYDISDFFCLFIKSGIAYLFESGDYGVIAGVSGFELAYKVLEESNVPFNRISPNYMVDRSKEYWAGWALAFYQWETSLSFEDIIRAIPIRDIVDMYTPYHEMDIRHFCDNMNEQYLKAIPMTNLKRIRMAANISQRELSELSGVPVRTIQQYEQRQKNINKAQTEYPVKLAKALYCQVNDLLENI